MFNSTVLSTVYIESFESEGVNEIDNYISNTDEWYCNQRDMSHVFQWNSQYVHVCFICSSIEWWIQGGIINSEEK